LRAATVVRATALGLALLLATASGARAGDIDPVRLADLGQKALRLYDELDFNRAKATLDQALAAAKGDGLDQSPIAARLHLYLGLVLAAGLQRPDDASAEFKLAVNIDPTIYPPDGLFNPEVAALFAAARAAAAGDAPATPPGPPAAASDETTAGGDQAATKEENAGDEGAAAPAAGGDAHADADAGGKNRVRPPAPAPRPAATDENDDIAGEADASGETRPYFLALGLGAGGGTASGHIDMKGVTPSTAPGGFAMSELGHVTMSAGYFWSRDWLFALEARLQLVSGPTPHCAGSVCSQPSGFAAAVLAKASYFRGDGPFKLFGTGGIGGGNIRQIVKLNGLPDCGQSGHQQCYDTVTGGPVLIAAGGGAAYTLGPVLVLAGLTANLGFPDFMLNIDLTLGAGVRF
jgi:hypothetical protein